jgi:hypothetical protein
MMTYVNTVAGALVIMMGAGMIADFDVTASDDRIDVRVWAPEDQGDARLHKHVLRKHVAALIGRNFDEQRIVVMPRLAA